MGCLNIKWTLKQEYVTKWSSMTSILSVILIISNQGEYLFSAVIAIFHRSVMYLSMMPRNAIKVSTILPVLDIVYARTQHRIWNKLVGSMQRMVGEKNTNGIQKVTLSSEMPSLLGLNDYVFHWTGVGAFPISVYQHQILHGSYFLSLFHDFRHCLQNDFCKGVLDLQNAYNNLLD